MNQAFLKGGVPVLCLLTLAIIGCVRPNNGSIGMAGTGDAATTSGQKSRDAGTEGEPPPFQPMPSRENPQAHRQTTGGQLSSSESYSAIRSAPPPPGTRVQQSERYRMVGGLIGAIERQGGLK
jgi:hypothetical protein